MVFFLATNFIFKWSECVRVENSVWMREREKNENIASSKQYIPSKWNVQYVLGAKQNSINWFFCSVFPNSVYIFIFRKGLFAMLCLCVAHTYFFSIHILWMVIKYLICFWISSENEISLWVKNRKTNDQNFYCPHFIQCKILFSFFHICISTR